MGTKGMEMSINFLVVVILGLAMLSMGVLTFTKFFKGAATIKEKYDSQTDAQLDALLSSGDRVAVPFPKKSTVAGDTAVFGIGILNILGKEQLFVVDVKCDEFIPRGKTDPEACSSIDKNIIFTSDHTLKNNEQQKQPIAVASQRSDRQGTYIINVCVCEGRCICNGPPYPGNMYHDLHKIYLTII